MSLFPELESVPEEATRPPDPGTAPAERPQGYLALARKYRPNAFGEIIGQEATVSTLRNAVTSGRLHHAYLFSGIRGVGKTTAARLFARALNCVRGPTVDPCGACAPCREIAAGQSMDVIEIDAASNRGVDDVEPLREAARYAPARDRYKVFILDEVHMLSNAAFNSLLKILEEPPPRIVWILATTEYRKVPPTVVSRCQHFEFRRVPRAEIKSCLERIVSAEKAQVDPAGLDVIAAAAGGSVRDAVSLLDQVIAYAGTRASAEDVRNAIGAIDRRLLLQFLNLVAARDASRLLDLIASLAEGGVEFSQFAAGLVSTVRDATLLRFAAPGSRALSLAEDEAKELRDLAGSFSEDGLLRAFNALLDLPYALRGAPQPRFVLEAAALRLARLADLTPIEDVIARLAGAGPSTAAAPGSTPRAPAASSGEPAAGSSPPPGARSSSPPEIPQSAVAGGADEEPPHPAEDGPGDGDPLWRERFLAAAQSRKLSLRTCLEAASRIAIGGDVVEIVMPERQRFFRDALESPETRSLLIEAAAEAAGRPVTLSITVEARPGGDPEGSTSALPPTARRDRLLNAALSQPEVKRVMETFGGQIVDIQETP